MLSCRELEEKFQQHALAVKHQLDCVEQRKVGSEQGFKAVNQLLSEIKGLVGQAELETDKEKFPREWVNSVKKRVNDLKRTAIDRIDRLTLREVLGGEDISYDQQEDSFAENSMEANNNVLRRATLEVNRGIELGTNVTTNLAAHNEKLRKALNTNAELTGDLSLGTGLISDLEKRKRWEKNLCKIVFLSAAAIVVGFILLRYYWRR